MGVALIWPSLCLIAALLLLWSEAFIPSGGLIGVMAVGFLCVSLYLAFATTPFGWVFVFISGVLFPLSLALAVQLWPHTPMGKYLFLKPPAQEELMPEAHSLMLEHLVGQFGRSLTPLRPTGTVDFEGRRHEGLSEEGMIPANALVQVVKVRSGRLIVRKAEVPAGLDEPTS